jgi:hypothetical protein
MDNEIFCEKQPFRIWWIWVIILLLVGLGWWAFVQQIILNIPWGNKPMSDTGTIIVWVSTSIVLPIFMLILGLRTHVTQDGVYFKYFPLHLRKKSIPREDIVKCEAIEFHPIREYGGWGIRYGKSGWAYIVSGKKGVMIEKKNGKKVLIGSLKADELANAINSILK